MATLSNLKLSDAIQLGSELRNTSAEATSMEDAATRTARFLYNNLTLEGSTEPACVLVRVYKTHPFGDLDSHLQEFATQILGSRAEADTRCLVLLGTEGTQPDWRSRKASRGHQAIPLPDPAFVARIPMVAELLRQLGVDVSQLLQGKSQQHEGKPFSVFLVEDAVGSLHIPAQKEFVVPRGVKSVLGFGAPMPGGDLFVTLMFCRIRVSRATADLFAPLSLNVKLSLLPFVGGALLDDGARS
jgi:hypothetical protein